MTGKRAVRLSRRAFLARAAAAGIATAAFVPPDARASADRRWDHTADFVSIGAGVAGLAAALSALEHDASVLMVDENFDIGGHGMVSGGLIHLGGGHSLQLKEGIEDSPDRVYEDWIRPDHPLARYNDRDLVRAYADESASTLEWLIATGVQFHPRMIGPRMASTVPRQVMTRQWPVNSEVYTAATSRRGSGLVRALEKQVRDKGATILLRHRMTSILRETPGAGRVMGIEVTHGDRTLDIRARKGVLIATGGHSNNVNLRRVFDPRLTEEYQVAGDPYSRKSGDGEIAALALGASLWGTAAQTNEAERCLQKAAHIGTRFGYRSLHWPKNSPIFDKIGGSGLTDVDWANVILVDQEGRRFHDETADDYDFIAAAMASHGDDPAKRNGGGPIWAIFDHRTVERQGWDPHPPHVDPRGYFFSAGTLAELASRIVNSHQPRSMPAETLVATVARYNMLAYAGVDTDFGKPGPFPEIRTPPFYAAWSTPLIHDSYVGLRTNQDAQVLDLRGAIIPGLYCAGESQGGINQHGLGRSLVFGRIAGRHGALLGDGLD